jgi:hypothetical protein
MGSNRRRAGAAMADAEDRRVGVRLDVFPQLGIVVAVIVVERDDAGLHARHVLGEPRLHLFEQLD